MRWASGGKGKKEEGERKEGRTYFHMVRVFGNDFVYFTVP
jgi:hypothetical protein